MKIVGFRFRIKDVEDPNFGYNNSKVVFMATILGGENAVKIGPTQKSAPTSTVTVIKTTYGIL